MPDICLQHMCAVMLLDGTISFVSAYDQTPMGERKILALRADGSSFAAGRAFGRHAESTRDRGDRFVRRQAIDPARQAVRGSVENPMTRLEVEDKSAISWVRLLEPCARKPCDANWELEKLTDVSRLRPPLRP